MSKKIIIFILIATAIILFFAFNMKEYFNLAYVKSNIQIFDSYYDANPVFAIAIFGLIYIAVTALSLPVATILTLTAGALFGILSGTIIVSFASTIGASLAFLASRFLMRDYVQKKYSDKLSAINKGIEKEGAFYLFTLRLVPIFPFFMINLIMGITPIKLRTFFAVSQVGMLAGTILYVYTGTQLATITTLKGIFSQNIIIAFSILGIFTAVKVKIASYKKKANISNNTLDLLTKFHKWKRK